MSRPRLVLINAAHEGGPSRRNFRRELDADLVEFDAVSGTLPSHTDFDGVVVTGSRSSVYDDDEWIDDTREWVQEAIDAGLPCLGICWGHQLLADAIGGTVADMGEYELGYRPIEQSADSPLFAGIGREFVSFESHSDQVLDLPDGAEVVAENDVAIQGFQHGTVFGVQFHPEFDHRTARKLLDDKEGSIDLERIEAVREQLTDEQYADASEAKTVFSNVLAIVDEHRKTVAAD